MPMCSNTRVRTVFAVSLLVITAWSIPARGDVTEKQADELAKAIEVSVNAGDGSLLDDSIDYAEMMSRTDPLLRAQPTTLAAISENVAKRLKPGAQTSAMVKQTGASFSYLHARGDAKDRRILFRTLNAQAFNYQEFLLRSDADGKARIVDIYVAATGELASQSMRRMADAAEASGAPASPVHRDGSVDSKLSDFLRFSGSGDAKSALAAYDMLPEKLKHDKTVLIHRIADSGKIDRALSLKYISEFQLEFPDDPAGYLLGISGFTDAKNYGKALESIEKLDKTLGGDPYLNYLRGVLYFAKGEQENAGKQFHKAIEADPTFVKPYLALMNIALKTQDFDEVARLMTLAEKNTKSRFTDVATVPAYAEFAKSDAYRKWLDSHRK